jgi:hypothetical protein
MLRDGHFTQAPLAATYNHWSTFQTTATWLPIISVNRFVYHS